MHYGCEFSTPEKYCSPKGTVPQDHQMKASFKQTRNRTHVSALLFHANYL
jgi:hypothetical protein